MTSRDFAYWLQGYFELTNPIEINEKETELIKRHLNLVFKHEIDPSMGDEKHQSELNKIHNQQTQKNNKFPTTEEEAVARWGAKPSPEHVFNLHGWYDPKHGIPRC
jgi:uncharacterized protein YfkK (UPF0435 family)